MVLTAVPSGTSGGSRVWATSSTRSRAAVSIWCGVAVGSACCDSGCGMLGTSALAACGASALGVGSAFGSEAAAALKSSPSPANTAIGVPTFTPSLPSGTRILAIVPSSTASNSIVALSVSISARISPDLTVSPSLTSHLASVPSSIVGDSAGIMSSVVINSSPPARRCTIQPPRARVRLQQTSQLLPRSL